MAAKMAAALCMIFTQFVLLPASSAAQDADTLLLERCQFWVAPDTVLVQGNLRNPSRQDIWVVAEAVAFDSVGRRIGAAKSFGKELVFGMQEGPGAGMFSVTLEVKRRARLVDSVSVVLRDTVQRLLPLRGTTCLKHRPPPT